MKNNLIKTAAFFVLASFPLLASAQIYKCIDQNGQTEFSDRPCADDAEVIEVNTSTTGISLGSQGDYSKVEKDNDLRDSERRISRLESEIKKLSKRRDKEVTEIVTKRESAISSRLNANYIQTLTTEIETVSKDYKSKIQSKRDEINGLYAERRKLKN